MKTSTMTSPSEGIVTDDQAERALDYLATTDAEFAAMKTAYMRAEFLQETVEDTVFLSFPEGSVEERKRRARLSPENRKAMENLFEVNTKLEMLKARRSRAMITIEVWRSVNSSRKAGLNL